MLPRLLVEAEAVADGSAGWAALPGGGGTAARSLGALAALCVGTVGSGRPPIAVVSGGWKRGVRRDGASKTL